MTPGHACPRTQPQTAGRRDFLDLKNRRSRACASGAYSTYVRMAHERDRRFLWLKSDGSSPSLTNTRAHKPTIHAFRDRVHNRISRKLPPRTPLTYKIPNASPKGMHQHEQHKNIPNKNKQPLIPKKHKLPTTLNTTAKDKAQKAAQQRLINNAARRTSCLSEASGINTNKQTQTRRKVYFPH